MGITAGVDVEGEVQSPVKERTDGKPLADVVAGWIWYPSVVGRVGLSEASVDALQRVEDSNLASYSDPEEKPEPKDVWQSAEGLRAALVELRMIFRKIRGDPSLIEEMETGDSVDYFYRDSLESGAYDLALEDAIKVCEWAEQHSKRVRLSAS